MMKVDKAKVLGCLQEISNSLTRIEAERDLIKEILQKMPEPVNSIPRLAMFLALIRPAKKHLIGKSWKEVSQTIWDRENDGYSFKKSHAVAYAHAIVVQMNKICEGISYGFS